MLESLASWYHQAVEKPNPLSEAIYLQWLEHLEQTLKQTLPPEVANDFEVRRRKVLTYLFPFLILQQSPFALPDLRLAVQLLRSFYEQQDGAKLCLFADSDADGLTAAAILYLFLRDVLKISPERLVFLTPGVDDKFGISDAFVTQILTIRPSLLITLDCGSSDGQTLANLKQAAPEIKLIVIDHHSLPITSQEYPPADAFVNPRRLPLTEESVILSTSAIVYKFIRGFLLSYSANYGTVYELVADSKSSFFIQDGVLVAAREAAQKLSWQALPHTFALEPLWQKEVRSNAELYKLDVFLRKVPEALTPLEKFLVLQNVLSKKTEERSKYALPLASVGIIADLMPLWSENRIIVREGLRIINQNVEALPVGFRELLRKLDLLRPAVNESDFAFTLCPAINAADRMGSPKTAFYALTAAEPLEAARQAYALRMLNEERKKVSRQAVELVAAELAAQPQDSPVLVVYHQEIHRGISGLVANRLAENYRKPAFVLVNDGDCLRGSARSYRNEDMFAFVSLLKERFIQFGGHRSAVGFSLSYEERQLFIEEVHRRAAEFFCQENRASQGAEERQQPKIYLHECELSTLHLESIFTFAPYGKHNPIPELIITTESPFKVFYLGVEKNHVKIQFSAFPALEVVWFFETQQAQQLNCSLPYRWVTEPFVYYFQGDLRYKLKVKKVIPLTQNNGEPSYGK